MTGAEGASELSQLPYWLRYVGAVATIVIALFAIIIAFGQYLTARQRVSLDLFQRRMELIDKLNSAAVRPPRTAVSCSSVKGTRTPPRSRGISTKPGFVQAAISRASLSFTQSGPGCCVLGKPYLLR